MNKIKQLNTVNQSFYEVNREHKDGLFRAVFRERKDLLELYNAMNDTDYKEPDDLIVYTLEDAVYIGIKNDISFLIGEILSLYEHQSTKNPNMPMRGLLYLARNFESYIEQNNLNIYGKVLQRFPLPQYYVFYNGTDDEPDRKVMKLSDAFFQIDGKEPCVECTATLLNINYGHNALLMEKCRQLKEYAFFIHSIRENQQKGMNTQQAVDQAIDDCIARDILKELLVKCRGEVRNMVLSTFNKEVYEHDLREEGETRKLIQLVCKKLKKNKSPEVIADELEEELTVIMKICDEAKRCEGEYDVDYILGQLWK